MIQERFSFRLFEGDPEELEIADYLAQLPKYRRSEFLRKIIKIGWQKEMRGKKRKLRPKVEEVSLDQEAKKSQDKPVDQEVAAPVEKMQAVPTQSSSEPAQHNEKTKLTSESATNQNKPPITESAPATPKAPEPARIPQEDEAVRDQENGSSVQSASEKREDFSKKKEQTPLKTGATEDKTAPESATPEKDNKKMIDPLARMKAKAQNQ